MLTQRRTYKFGDRVLNTARPEWGPGTVTRAENVAHNGHTAQRLNVRYTLQSQHQDPLTAVHSVIEEIALHNDPSQRAPIIATNVFVRGAMGWRIVRREARWSCMVGDRTILWDT